MLGPPGARPKDVLLVEDNLGDVRLIREGLGEGPDAPRLTVVATGIEALAVLRRAPPHAEAPFPDLIILDLNLPRRSGQEVLAEIKSEERLRRIPVVVLTTSTNAQDVALSYDLGANCYITKPMDLDGYLRVIRGIHDFWLRIATLPSAHPLGP